MKNFIILIVMAVSLLSPNSWSQMGAPSQVQELSISAWPCRSIDMVITNNNQYVIYSTNNAIDSNQRLTSYNSQLTKLWEQRLAYPEDSIGWYNNVVARNTDGILTVTNDSLLGYNADGQIDLRIKTPGYGTKMVFKDQSHYYVVNCTSSGSKIVTIYSNNLILISSWSIKNQVRAITGFVSSGGYVYVASELDGGGDSSNTSMDLDKYDLEGNLIWTKHLPDRNNPRLSLDKEGNLLLFSDLLFNTPTIHAWNIVKINPSGQQIWNKLWLGDYPGDTTHLFMSTRDIIQCGNGFICIGNSTRLGQDPHSPKWDLNSRDAVAIAFDSMGGIQWKIRMVDSVNDAHFKSAEFDQEGYLLLLGDVQMTNKLWKYYVPGVTSVTAENNSTPNSFFLSQNYPNPFNPSTAINFSITKPGCVSLKVYDLMGHEVANLVDENLNAGSYKVNFDAKNLASGVYVYQIRTNNIISSKKMVLVK